jgi:hypothetical protein
MALEVFGVELLLLEISGPVIANFPDVPRAQAPALACDHCRGDLAARAHIGGEKPNFRIEGREIWQADNRVRGVQAHANHIHARDF